MTIEATTNRAPDVGAVPGMLIDDPTVDIRTVQVIAYGPDDVAEVELELAELDSIDQITALGPVVWFNVDGNRDASVMRTVGKLFELHPLALEDVNKGGQRPKLDHYGGHLFIVTRIADPRGDELETEQISIFVGPGFVVTFQERPGDCFESVRDRIRQARGRIRGVGADYLAYALVDAIIDHFGVVVDAYGDRLEQLEHQVLGGAADSAIPALMDTRHDLHSLRRLAMGSRKVIEKMLDRELDLVHPDTRTYLHDCHDHAMRLLETIDGWRELGANLMELHLALAGQQLNAIMKVLTIISTIFIPLSFIAGVYGMNFERSASPLNMPELGWYFGYPFAIVLMLGIVGLQLAYFRRKGWLRAS